MHPILFQFGALTVYTYGVLVASGFVLGLWYACRQAPRAGLNQQKVWNLGIYTILAGLVFSKLWLVLSAREYYAQHPGEVFSLAVFQSGGDFYGGFLGGILLIAAYSYFQKISILALLDTFSGGLALGHGIGRLGCFAAGCCYGKPTSLPWGVTFTSEAAARLAGTPLGVSLHPTQLYEAAAEFLNFLLLVWLGKRQWFTGQLLGAYLILYGIERGSIEFVRGDPGRTMMLHNSVSLMQVVSLAMIFTGAILWRRGLRGEAPIQVAAPARAPSAR